jgi:hypothetical protein
MPTSEQLSVGFLGVGSIAKYHAEVLQTLGHAVTVACGTSAGSPRWREFKSIAPQAQFEADGRALLQDPTIDAVVACLPWNVTETWLPDLLSTPKPVLMEKPVALSAETLSRAIEHAGATLDNKIVGLNRRFYRTVQELQIRVEQGGVKSVEITISETVRGLAKIFGDEIIEHILAYSSCHILDTACYVLGRLAPVKVYGFDESSYAKDCWSFAGLLETNEGAPVFLNVLADNPAPVGMRIFFNDQTTWHLSPLERLVAYREYDVIEPTDEAKVRRYVPKPFFEIDEDTTFKPGFLAQMEAFTSRQNRQISATVKDSLELLKFTEELRRMADSGVIPLGGAAASPEARSF